MTFSSQVSLTPLIACGVAPRHMYHEADVCLLKQKRDNLILRRQLAA